MQKIPRWSRDAFRSATNAVAPPGAGTGIVNLVALNIVSHCGILPAAKAVPISPLPPRATPCMDEIHQPGTPLGR